MNGISFARVYDNALVVNLGKYFFKFIQMPCVKLIVLFHNCKSLGQFSSSDGMAYLVVNFFFHLFENSLVQKSFTHQKYFGHSPLMNLDHGKESPWILELEKCPITLPGGNPCKNVVIEIKQIGETVLQIYGKVIRKNDVLFLSYTCPSACISSIQFYLIISGSNIIMRTCMTNGTRRQYSKRCRNDMTNCTTEAYDKGWEIGTKNCLFSPKVQRKNPNRYARVRY